MSLANTVLTKEDMLNQHDVLRIKFWDCLDKLYVYILSTDEYREFERLTSAIGRAIDKEISLAKYVHSEDDDTAKEINESLEERHLMSEEREKLMIKIKSIHETLPDKWAVQMLAIEKEIKVLDEDLAREHNLYPCSPWRGFWDEVFYEVDYD